jgi:hypothetical protein
MAIIEKRLEDALKSIESAALRLSFNDYDKTIWTADTTYPSRSVMFVDAGIVYVPLQRVYVSGVSIEADEAAGKLFVLSGLTVSMLASGQEAMDGVAGLIPDAAGVLASINNVSLLKTQLATVQEAIDGEEGKIPDAMGVKSAIESAVEYGVNANGEYWKYPDGRLVCINSTGPAVEIDSPFGNLFWHEGTLMTFPYAFISEPRVIPTNNRELASTAGVVMAALGIVSDYKLEVKVYMLSPINTSLGSPGYVATGRWK